MHAQILKTRLEKALKDDDLKYYFVKLYSETANLIISDPCQKPNLTKVVYINILDKLNLTEEEITSITKHLYQEQWVIANNPLTNLFLFLTSAAIAAKEPKYEKLFLTFACLVQHGKLMVKYIKFCRPEILRYVLDTMPTRSYIKKHGNIIMVFDRIAQDELDKFRDRLGKYDDDVYIRVIVSIRNKLNQWMKLIAKKYYEAHNNKSYSKQEDETYEPESITGKRINYEYITDSVLSNIAHHPTIESTTLDTMNKLFRIDRNAIDHLVKNFVDLKQNEKSISEAIIALLNESKLSTQEAVCSDKLTLSAKLLIVSRRPRNDYKDAIMILIRNGLKSMGKDLDKLSSETRSKLMAMYNYMLLHFINRTFCR